MFDNMQRLHPRGAANRGICVDAEGAMLGPDCVLVSRAPNGFHAIGRDEASAVQKCLLDSEPDHDWLFLQCQRIASALGRGELAMAQIYGLRIPIADLDDRQLRRIAGIGLAKAGFNRDEPRIPKGDPHGGEWTTGDSVAPSASPAFSTDLGFSTETTEGGMVPPESDPRQGGASAGNEGVVSALGPILPVADFSGGFHDAVVKEWVEYFQKNGVPVVTTPAIRAIGPDSSVIGYPDMVTILPGVGLAVIEVKTGEVPTYTPNQTAYYPLIQIGEHVYTTDTRISRLGLSPGVPFPAMPVYILHAPGPGRQYDAWKLSPPQFRP